MADASPFPVLTCDEPGVIPTWATLQRHVFDQAHQAADAYTAKYCNADGELIWRDHWPGMDGSDDGYEAFTSFPLLHALGGHDSLGEMAARHWEAVTRQFTRYGQVHREFDAYYDWMHHGESSLYLYFLAMSRPDDPGFRERAVRFAGLYTGDDPEAPNWDAHRRLIRSPINGSRGPRFETTAEDWCTHREILATYLSPFEDVPGHPLTTGPMHILDWNDDAVFEPILQLMNQRMMAGDVPLNLTATSLVTHAYLLTGDERYRQWTLDYLQAWVERRDANHGILPDNVGPTGDIGECMEDEGQWWGGYYGWRWPHGAMNLLEATLIAGSNVLLMTGDASLLDLTRSQHDLIWSLGRRDETGAFVTPKRHGDEGWFDYQVPNVSDYVHLAYLTFRPDDVDRLERCGELARVTRPANFGKGGQFQPIPWHAFIQGLNADYPEQVLHATLAEMERRLEVMRHDDSDPATWDPHHWQDINPVLPQGLLQLTMGSPGFVYHGGHVHACVRHFDPQRNRPGLPEGVAALVDRIDAEGCRLRLVNTKTDSPVDVVVQAGAFGEHAFTSATMEGDPAGAQTLDARCLTVRLAPGAVAAIDLGLRRFAHAPDYALPWSRR